MALRDEWNGFTGGHWVDDINVRDFIQRNYTAYDGDDSFLAGPTDATDKLWGKVQELQAAERANNGVLECETEIVSGLTAYGPGYIDADHKELEKIVGLQTDKPLKRAFMPYGGIKMAQQAAENYGFHVNDKYNQIFNEYRKTHNQGVFDAYTPEMRAARHSHVITGLPDTYGREAAKFVVERLEAKGVTEGTIGITQNGPNVTENAANDGFRSQVLELDTNFTIADTVYEGVEVAEAANKVTGVIQANADIVAGFGTTGGSPQSWATAMQNTGKTDLVVVGMDYTELNVNLVKDGSITAIVCQPLYDEAQACVETLKELFEGKTFNGSESEWFVELDAPLAYVDGEGVHDINSYQEIIDKVVEYFA